jgi:ATP-dependent DNA helicase RecQ
MAIGHGALGERERVLLSVAERAGAVELQPGGSDGLLVTLTGRGSPHRAQAAIAAARNRGWESYRSIERFSSDGQRCRRRQILDHFGDGERGRPTGRCCDVCDPDAALMAVLQAPLTGGAGRRRRASSSQAAHAGAPGGQVSARADVLAQDVADDPVDEREFDKLRAWRWERAEGKPAYTVAANKVLEEVLRRRPQTVPELLQIRGIGDAFCDKHGESLLAAVAQLD